MHASIEEVEEFHRWLDRVPDSGVYVEVGTGGSAKVANSHLKPGVRMVLMDGTKEWLDKVVLPPTRRNTKVHLDIGATGDWGKPLGALNSKWPLYSTAIDEYRADAYFIDGRFRVACICRAAMNAKPGAVIMVHDFWDRPKYHVVLSFLETIGRVDTLGVFRVRTLDGVGDIWEKHKYDFN